MSTYKSSANIVLGDSVDQTPGSLPNQRISRRGKQSKKWQKESMNFFITNRYQNNYNRKSVREIRENWDFYNAVLTDSEIKKHLDPLNVEQNLIDDEVTAFEFYDILHQPFDTLFGEELKRTSDVKAYAVNPNIINQKDRKFKQQVIEFLQKTAEAESIDEKMMQEKLKEFDHLRKHDLQSAHEEMANQILEGLKNDTDLNLKYKFNRGFKNLEVVGEEIYRVGNIGKEISITSVQSENFFALSMGKSEWIQDANAWIEIDYMNIHKVIEEFAEDLTDKEIDELLTAANAKESWLVPTQLGVYDLDENPGLIDPTNPIKTTFKMDSDEALGLIPLDDNDQQSFDENRNLKVYRVQWLSLRKIGELKYYDEQGHEQKKLVDEYYVANIEEGEEIKWYWINELWEGCRLGNDIYKKVRVSPIQMRSITNPSIVKPSYVGYVISQNGVSTQCRVDKLKPYQRMYNTFANKLITLWTQNLGKITKVNMAEMPSEMEPDEWYLWIKRFKLMFYNPFEEGTKGAAKGQLAGHMSQSTTGIDLSLTTEINQTIETLNWIEQRVNKIAAIPEPRQGDMTGNEGLGTSQQAIVQSSHQTEVDFFVHDLVQSKVFELAIEYIKVLWRDDKSKRQYVLDDLSEHIIDIDGELLAEAEFGITITNSSKLYEMFNSIKALSHAAMQTGTASLSDIARLNMATSPSEMLRKLEEAEDKKQEQAMQQAQMQQEAQQAQLQAAQQLEQMKHQQDLEKMDREWQYKLKEKEMDLIVNLDQHNRDMNENGVEDEVELESERIKVEGAEKLQDEKFTHEKAIQKADLENKVKIERIKGLNKPTKTSKGL